MAIAAYAMAALSQGIELPPGAIHVSRELGFAGMVNVGGQPYQLRKGRPEVELGTI